MQYGCLTQTSTVHICHSLSSHQASSTRKAPMRAQSFSLALLFAYVLASLWEVGDGFELEPPSVEENVEDQVDDRTLLDIFGEVAKEYLTQRVIPDTDEECRWDWRYARCEPNCSCGLEFRWGDYHLGRSCRVRTNTEAGEKCDIPPDTPYAKLFDVVMNQGRVVSEQVKATAVVVGAQAKHRLDEAIEQACDEVPRDCGVAHVRSIREKLLCTHIPPCDETNAKAWGEHNGQPERDAGEFVWS